ncbi:hydroxymethylglutaryl-CoA lyase [Octadecabacter sp.]|nr:hydroxymethylglutaryl-CoA lyase [Octadecabacter sp.]
MSETVTIFEVGPRDGLQNESALIATEDKIALVDMLTDCGLSRIEVTSFVSPKWVPQMADAADVLAGINRKAGVTYTALTPNLRGFQAAQTANADEVAIFASASEGFSQNNINCSVAESLERFAPVAKAATDAGLQVRGYVSCVTECPYDGLTPPQQVADVANALIDLGCYQVSLGDTIGRATPNQTEAMLDTIMPRIPANLLAGHFHDTLGGAIANMAVSLDRGIRCFDTSIAGLGGCPYAPGAAGNVSTESVAAFLTNQGFETGLDVQKLAAAAHFANTLRTTT